MSSDKTVTYVPGRADCGCGIVRSDMQSLSRRQFALLGAAAPFVLKGQSAPLRARIKIDTERVIGDIDPLIYGNFMEHLGRCIEGGLFDEGNPLSDSNGFRKDVMQAVRGLNVTQLRWP